jgi:hypothetical protein
LWGRRLAGLARAFRFSVTVAEAATVTVAEAVAVTVAEAVAVTVAEAVVVPVTGAQLPWSRPRMVTSGWFK